MYTINDQKENVYIDSCTLCMGGKIVVGVNFSMFRENPNRNGESLINVCLENLEESLIFEILNSIGKEKNNFSITTEKFRANLTNFYITGFSNTSIELQAVEYLYSDFDKRENKKEDERPVLIERL